MSGCRFSQEEISSQNQVKASVQRKIRQSIAEEVSLSSRNPFSVTTISNLYARWCGCFHMCVCISHFRSRFATIPSAGCIPNCLPCFYGACTNIVMMEKLASLPSNHKGL